MPAFYRLVVGTGEGKGPERSGQVGGGGEGWGRNLELWAPCSALWQGLGVGVQLLWKAPALRDGLKSGKGAVGFQIKYLLDRQVRVLLSVFTLASLSSFSSTLVSRVPFDRPPFPPPPLSPPQPRPRSPSSPGFLYLIFSW